MYLRKVFLISLLTSGIVTVAIMAFFPFTTHSWTEYLWLVWFFATNLLDTLFTLPDNGYSAIFLLILNSMIWAGILSLVYFVGSKMKAMY